MLKEQYPYIDENGNERAKLIKHYSDSNKYILQVETGIEYTEAIDVYPCPYTYVEIDKPIEVDEVTKMVNEATKKVTDELTDAVNALNVLGVS